jgi:nucleolar MIF4G domain-containing protein 1
MIETLTNLKNNKLKRNVTQNQGGAAVERMKKFLSNLSKTRHGTFFEPTLFPPSLKQIVLSPCT